MNVLAVIWFAVGILTGVGHAWLLWQGTKPPFDRLGLHGPRLLLIALVLFSAAILGGLIPAIGGWMVGYFPTVAFVALRRSA